MEKKEHGNNFVPILKAKTELIFVYFRNFPTFVLF